jgi:predicted enzyme related to lactoylglutathione lyase
VIRGVHSTIIWTDDLPRLAGFYRDTLGLRPAAEFDGFIEFQSDAGAALAIGFHSEVSGRSRDPNRVMVNLQVDDCRAEYERLSARGVKFIRTPSIDPADGLMIATFLDPDGNTLQLVQPPA